MKSTICFKCNILGSEEAGAALYRQQLAQYTEDCLEQKLALDESKDNNLKEWIGSLPKVSPCALSDFERNISADNFRELEEDMRK